MSEGRRGDIQGLRAIAVLLVVLYHSSSHAPGGFTGVDAFFAISGYVITGLLMRELGGGRPHILQRFYLRRIKRLFPALALMVSVVALLAVPLTQFGEQMTAMKTGLAATFFSANAYLISLPNGYFDLGDSADPFLHTWSLAVEEQFYVLFPIILLTAWRFGRRAAFLAIAAITAASLTLSIVFSYGDSGQAQRFAFYGSPTRAWEFGLGALVALAAPKLTRLAAEAAAATGVVMVLGGAVVLRGTGHYPGLAALIPVVGTLLVIVGAGTLTSRLLALPPLTWLGDVSYSWYLWHWPLIVIAGLWSQSVWALRGAAVVSLVVAWASFRWFENPIRYSTWIVNRRVLGLAAVCVGVTAAACGVLAVSHRELPRVSSMRAWLASQDSHVAEARGCNLIPQRARCVWPATPARGTVELVGDSNAGHFSEPVLAAGAALALTVRLVAPGGCPFVAIRIRTLDHAVDRVCTAHNRAILQRILHSTPRVVVIANRDDEYITDQRSGFARLDGGPTEYSEDAKAALWESGLASVMHAIQKAGSRVLLVRPVPFMTSDPRDCPVISVLMASCDHPEPRAKVEQELQQVTVDERRALASTKSAYLDLETTLCSQTLCPAKHGDTYLYSDHYHLSVAGALMLTGRFERAIRSLIPASPRSNPRRRSVQ